MVDLPDVDDGNDEDNDADEDGEVKSLLCVANIVWGVCVIVDFVGRNALACK